MGSTAANWSLTLILSRRLLLLLKATYYQSHIVERPRALDPKASLPIVMAIADGTVRRINRILLDNG